MLCQIVIGTQFQNFTFKCCFLSWPRASEKVDCYPKMFVGKVKLVTNSVTVVNILK